ncbi:MAG: hypothetical protein R3F43_18280 [bacterium]
MTALLVGLGLLAMAGQAVAQATGVCRTPREAARTFRQPPGGQRPPWRWPSRASSGRRGSGRRPHRAGAGAQGRAGRPRPRQDGRPARCGGPQGRQRLAAGRAILVGGLEGVYFERIAGEWQLPAAVVQRVPRLYSETFSGGARPRSPPAP